MVRLLLLVLNYFIHIIKSLNIISVHNLPFKVQPCKDLLGEHALATIYHSHAILSVRWEVTQSLR